MRLLSAACCGCLATAVGRAQWAVGGGASLVTGGREGPRGAALLERRVGLKRGGARRDTDVRCGPSREWKRNSSAAARRLVVGEHVQR